MKLTCALACAAAIAFAACTNSKNNETMIQKNPKVVQLALDSLKARYADVDAARSEKGIAQAAGLWSEKDGDEKTFVAFCAENYVNDASAREALFINLSEKLETLFGHFNSIDRGLKKRLNEDVGELQKIDLDMGSYDVRAHFNDDMFASKIAFSTIINFPAYSLAEKQQLAQQWSRLQWGYARLGDLFTSRIPAEVQQQLSNANTASEAYISEYNIIASCLRNEANEQLFTSSRKLISHWDLRDEIKARYAGNMRDFERQEMIYAAMKRIVTQQIPQVVINSDRYTWNPVSNKVFEDGKELAATPEPDTRYQIFINNFKACKAVDPYTPQYPTYISRSFDGSMEFSKEEVRNMFIQLVSSPQVKEVATLIEQRLGRRLMPFDIWYDGFKQRSSIDNSVLTTKVSRLYANAGALERGLPDILRRLGFTPADAQRICSHIVVDAARGSGHAWGAMMKGDKAHLRTRVPANGMDYKGYNIAMHELGHNVEQTISLYDMDYYLLSGVPNTAFTEALAFIFQKRDLEVLGMSQSDPLKNDLTALDIFWNCYEIMGVSLVDMAAWEWLYANPNATPAQLKENIIRIAREIWNSYYEPVLGEKDSPILAIYSHMINAPLYLSNYPMGHLIELQLEEYLQGKNFASEVQRIFSLGRLTPQQWMKEATGSELSVEPTIKAAEAAVSKLK